MADRDKGVIDNETKRYHVIVSGTEFFLDVEQIGGTQDVPMIGRQENNISWNRYGREHINPSQKK